MEPAGQSGLERESVPRQDSAKEPGPHPPENHTECSTSLLIFLLNPGK